MKKFWKVAAVIFTVLAVLFFVVLIVIFVALPSPSLIRAKMKASTTPPVKSGAVSAAVLSPKTASDSAATSSAATDASVELTPEEERARKQKENEELFFKFLDEGGPLSSACNSLSNIKYPQNAKLDPKTAEARFKNMLQGNHNDPEFESMRPFVKFVVTRPATRELIEMVRHAEPGDAIESIKNKTRFYAQAYEMYLDVKKSEPQIREIIDQNYLTMMMGRAVEQNPALAGDSATRAYCEEIEAHINNETAPDFTSEKRAFEEFMAKNNIDPQKIGYDPNYKTTMAVEFGQKSIEAKAGWIQDVLEQAVDLTSKRVAR